MCVVKCVRVDENLSTKQHVERKCRVASVNLQRIKRIRKYLDTEICKLLVQALVMSHLDYANALFYGITKGLMRKLQLVQNAAARLVLQRNRFSSATKNLKDLHWLNINKRVHFKVLCFVHDCIHGNAPVYLKEKLTLKRFNRRTRLSSQNSFLLDNCRKTLGDRAFSHCGPILWNKLPDNIRQLKVKDQFKRELKTHLFDL